MTLLLPCRDSESIHLFTTKNRKSLLSRYCYYQSAPELLSRVKGDNDSLLGCNNHGWMEELFKYCHLNTDAIPGLKSTMEKIGTWEFNVAEVTQFVPGHTLLFVGSYIIRLYDFHYHFRIDFNAIRNLLCCIEERYSKNAYHNSEHGADVMHSMHCLLLKLDGNACQSYEKLACLIAAAAHDIGHFGLTNDFLKVTHHEVVVKFGNVSTLEKMHAWMALELLHREECNVFRYLPKRQQEAVDQLVRKMILATDISQQEKLLSLLPTWKVDLSIANVSVIFAILLNAADLAHSTKDFALHRMWADRVTEEFLLQGDKEKSLGLDYSFGCSPSTLDKTYRMHISFLKMFVLPLYKTIQEVFQMDVSKQIENIVGNIEQWTTLVQCK